MQSGFSKISNLEQYKMTDGPEEGTSVILFHGIPGSRNTGTLLTITRLVTSKKVVALPVPRMQVEGGMDRQTKEWK